MENLDSFFSNRAKVGGDSAEQVELVQSQNLPESEAVQKTVKNTLGVGPSPLSLFSATPGRLSSLSAYTSPNTFVSLVTHGGRVPVPLYDGSSLYNLCKNVHTNAGFEPFRRFISTLDSVASYSGCVCGEDFHRGGGLDFYLGLRSLSFKTPQFEEVLMSVPREDTEVIEFLDATKSLYDNKGEQIFKNSVPNSWSYLLSLANARDFDLAKTSLHIGPALTYALQPTLTTPGEEDCVVEEIRVLPVKKFLTQLHAEDFSVLAVRAVLIDCTDLGDRLNTLARCFPKEKTILVLDTANKVEMNLKFSRLNYSFDSLVFFRLLDLLPQGQLEWLTLFAGSILFQYFTPYGNTIKQAHLLPEYDVLEHLIYVAGDKQKRKFSVSMLPHFLAKCVSEGNHHIVRAHYLVHCSMFKTLLYNLFLFNYGFSGLLTAKRVGFIERKSQAYLLECYPFLSVFSGVNNADRFAALAIEHNKREVNFKLVFPCRQDLCESWATATLWLPFELLYAYGARLPLSSLTLQLSRDSTYYAEMPDGYLRSYAVDADPDYNCNTLGEGRPVNFLEYSDGLLSSSKKSFVYNPVSLFPLFQPVGYWFYTFGLGSALPSRQRAFSEKSPHVISVDLPSVTPTGPVLLMQDFRNW